MRRLGIDFGKKKIGLALSDSILAEPYGVIRYESLDEAIRKLESVVKREGVEELIVGVSEGKSGKEAKDFGDLLGVKLDLPVVFQDETLTSHEARELSIQAEIKRKKRKSLEDAYAACLILQAFLDSKQNFSLA